MFISSYEGASQRLNLKQPLRRLVQLEYSGFEGATVPICTFALQTSTMQNMGRIIIRLSIFVEEKQG